MTKDNATYISRNFQIFEGKKLSQQQCEIAVRYALGETTDEIGENLGITSSGVRKELAVARGAFGGVSSSCLRSIIFMRILCHLSISKECLNV
ncbi:helix-turn-helix transcriptional regulator [Xenorhabdus entomophaga]|uniref:helix-turn-helix transcriptional regulator n=1 Tax=Xenorhabdus entomophaga TaxID=3136257 RepID=UPI0030F3A04A